MNKALTRMTLPELIEAPNAPLLEISGLCEDSRSVCPGDAFVATRGGTSDGHDYAAAAARGGAVCILAERPLPELSVPVVQLGDLRERRGALAAKLYGDPSADVVCVGVTGTNGKTTIAHHIACLAQGLGLNAGYLGTLGWGAVAAAKPPAAESRIPNGALLDCRHSGGKPGRGAKIPRVFRGAETPQFIPSRLTTEGAIATQKRLACLRRLGCGWAVLEASSHALAQRRVDNIAFDFAVFSNLTRDHLDYHKNFAAYAAAKRRLFQFPGLRCAVINIDDDFGRRLAGSLTGMEVVTYGRGDADILWGRLAHRRTGVRGLLQTPWGDVELAAPVCGDFGLANLAAAVGVLGAAGKPLDAVAEAVAGLPPVPGRMEFIRLPGRPSVVVDYAHTPDALAKALTALRRHCRGKLICVIGCGGDRDAGKRPIMARVAADLADQAWFTSDNPRSENPAAIIADMLAGLDDASKVTAEADRASAIAAAIAAAAAQDLVMVAGKGHEDHQEVSGKKHPFSDRTLARLVLEAQSGRKR